MQKEKLPNSIRFYRNVTEYPSIRTIFKVLDDLGIIVGTDVNGWVDTSVLIDKCLLLEKFIEDTNYPPIYPYTVISDYYKEFALAFAKWIYENYDIGGNE